MAPLLRTKIIPFPIDYYHNILYSMYIHSTYICYFNVDEPQISTHKESAMNKSDKSICYCTNIRRISNAITNYYDNALKETGLTVPQYDLLLTLSRLEKANTTQWAKHVGLERTTMVRNAQLLQSRGLIERTDGPGKTYTLSENGMKALEKASMLWVRTQMKIKSFLGKEDTAAIMRIESKIQNLPVD